MSYFIDALFELKKPEQFVDIFEEIDKINVDKQFLMKDIGITARVFSHWESKGIIIPRPKLEEYRHEFSFLELIWFNIVKELREYGYPIEKIKLVFNELMRPYNIIDLMRSLPDEQKEKIIEQTQDNPIKDEEGNEISIKQAMHDLFFSEGDDENETFFINSLLLLIIEFIQNRSDIRILIDTKGKVMPYVEGAINVYQCKEIMNDYGLDSESHISISLTKFFQKFISNKEFLNFAHDNDILNENEGYILSLIREGKAKSITIKFAGQKPTMIEITEERKIFAESRLSDTILKRKYQEIIIKTNDGEIAYANITTKKKLK